MENILFWTFTKKKVNGQRMKSLNICNIVNIIIIIIPSSNFRNITINILLLL
jgi:hypothetical protein